MTEMKGGRTQNRRAFLKSAAGFGGLLLAAGGTHLTLASAGPRVPAVPGIGSIGVQLYTLRGLLEQDFEGTIEAVAKIGFKEVEFAGYYERSPEQVRKLLDRLGLTAPSAHVGLDVLRDDLEGALSAAQTIGHRYVTVPALPGAFGGTITADDWRRYAEEFNRLGRAAQEKGLRFAYHNHGFEFIPADGETTGYDILLAETDPALVSFELDLMWTVFAGQDPLALFERHPGRFVMWHVKDMREIEATRAAMSQGPAGFRSLFERIAAVGEGEIDFKPIFARAEQSGLLHFFVENDAPKDALQDVQTSYSNLKKMLT